MTERCETAAVPACDLRRVGAFCARTALLPILALLAGSPARGSTVPNDNFASAQVLSGPRGVVTCYTVGASREANEPYIAGNHSGGASIWFRWTAPVTGSFQFDTESSEFDTLLAVYTGNSLGSLSLVGSNDNIDRNNLQSRVIFNATAGTVYQITVDGKSAAAGYAVLTWLPGATSTNPPPPNDNFAAAQVLSGPSGTVTGSTINATRESNEPYPAGVPSGKTVWYRWIAPSSGMACFDASACDFDTVLGVYTSAAGSALTEVQSNNDIDNFTRQSRVIFPVIASQEYELVVGGVQMPSGAIREGTVVLSWFVDPNAGSNDLFANAELLQGPHGVALGTSVGASVEPGEPVRFDNSGGQSIWYRWTTPVSGQVIFDTAGSQFYSPFFNYILLTAYSGDRLSSLASVADNYDFATGGYFSSITFNAQAGWPYSISVDGYYDPVFCHCVAVGSVYLAWTQPSVVLLYQPRLAAPQSLEMNLLAPKGRACTLYCSTNLTQWDPVTNFVTSAFSTTVTADLRRPGRFFRAVVSP